MADDIVAACHRAIKNDSSAILCARATPTIWLVDAHRDGKRFIVPADEKLTAFVEAEAAIQGLTLKGSGHIAFPDKIQIGNSF